MTIPDWILVTYGWFLGVGAVTTILVWGLVWLTSRNPDERRWVEVKCARYRIDPARFRMGRQGG